MGKSNVQRLRESYTKDFKMFLGLDPEKPMPKDIAIATTGQAITELIEQCAVRAQVTYARKPRTPKDQPPSEQSESAKQDPPRELTRHQKATKYVMELCYLLPGQEAWAGKCATFLEKQNPVPSRKQMARLYDREYRDPVTGKRAWWYSVHCRSLDPVPDPTPESIMRTLGPALAWDRAEQAKVTSGAPSLARPGVPMLGGA